MQNSRAYEVEQNGQDLHQRIDCMIVKDSETFSFQIEYKPQSEMSIFSLSQ